MTDTKTRILDLAENLTQSKGFNGFSYLDLAAEVGIKTSSIHYHYKSKADLALALVERHREALEAAFKRLDDDVANPADRLESIVTHFKGYIGEEKICMCGMMAAEFESISPAVRKALALYFRDFQNWLAKQFSALGHPNPPAVALQYVSALEGSLLLARLEGDASVVDRSLDGFVNT
ncbi:TetR/AcrR family transcriptional regulator [uncultured Tateyamaria sp.]|uniref:TetR/AcrR family transcriptional regulator n=1 Tax=uncultured Tateyamaria sp. TaxID=455651 RepID=UPI002633DD38|nr:TetR/AcrR family transcriptional regulator [uncultured Tateyamaria sp.]